MRETSRQKAFTSLEQLLDWCGLTPGDNPAAERVRAAVGALKNQGLTEDQLYLVWAIVEAVALRLVQSDGNKPACENYREVRLACQELDELWADSHRGQDPGKQCRDSHHKAL